MQNIYLSQDQKIKMRLEPLFLINLIGIGNSFRPDLNKNVSFLTKCIIDEFRWAVFYQKEIIKTEKCYSAFRSES